MNCVFIRNEGSLPPIEQRDLTLRDLKAIYSRRRPVLQKVTLAVFALAALYCTVATRRYEASGLIEVKLSTQDGLGLDSMLSGKSTPAEDALTANIGLQTEANILQSDTLALKTIEKLKLEGTDDFRPHWNPVTWFLGLLTPAGTPDAVGNSLADSPQRRHRVLQVFDRFLAVKPVNGTRLIEITYLSSDPKTAAAVVNTLATSLIDYANSARLTGHKEETSWLDGQMEQLKRKSEALEKNVADLQGNAGIYNLGITDGQGHAQAYSGVIDQLQQATIALAQAEQNRILRGAIAHAAENGDADMLSGLAGSAVGAGAANNSLLLIQNLRAQEAALTAQLRQAEVKYDEGYPKLAELRGSVAGIQHSIRDEVQRVKGRAQTDLDVASRTEDDTRRHYEQVKAQADLLNNKSVDLAVLRQEADQSRKLYLDLFTKFNEATTFQGLGGSIIEVVDPGRVPSKPKKPNIPVYLGIAIVGGLLLGYCVALVIDTVDRRVNTIAEVQRMTSQEVPGVVPFRRSSLLSTAADNLVTDAERNSRFSESLRAIRNSLTLVPVEEVNQIIQVASSVSGEGKTMIAVNLAAVLAKAGRKVLLVDANLRNGRVGLAYSLPASKGLSNLLVDQTLSGLMHKIPSITNLHVLQAGDLSLHPADLLVSDTFRNLLGLWREDYEHIVVDSEALLEVSDGLALAALSDVTLLIVRLGLVGKAQVDRSLRLVNRVSNRPAWLIANGIKEDADEYQEYFGCVSGPDKEVA